MATAAPPGLVEPGILYRMDELCLRLGWSRKSWDAAKRRGLRVLRSGKRVYVKGSDALAFIEKDAADQEKRLAQA
jgi:hypothetical protein